MNGKKKVLGNTFYQKWMKIQFPSKASIPIGNTVGQCNMSLDHKSFLKPFFKLFYDTMRGMKLSQYNE